MIMVRTMDGVIHTFEEGREYKHVGDEVHSILKIYNYNEKVVMQFNFDHIVNYGHVNEPREYIADWDESKVIQY